MNRPIGFLNDEFERASGAGEAASVPAPDGLSGSDVPNRGARSDRELFDALPVAIYTTDADGRITYYNDAAADLWGYRPPLGSSKGCGSWRLYRPDGTPMAHAASPMSIALKEKRPLRGVEVIAERPNGKRVPCLANPTPLYDDAGRLTGGINLLVDITERKRADEQRSLLIRELHHRVKNTLATVQAIMGATARTAGNIEEFQTALIRRIGSLAKTHLLLAEETRAVSFAGLLRKELGAFDDEGRILISGPPVDLPQPLAVSLGMALHELTTNAAKFGALSVARGQVTATWRLTLEADRQTLDFDWVEHGGPPVTPPARKGFGTRLLEVVLPGQIHAHTRIDYAPQGVRVHCTVPLAPLD